MCGITAAVSLNFRTALNAVCRGIAALQNRGNDSFGLACFDQGKIRVEKSANLNKDHFEIIMKDKIESLRQIPVSSELETPAVVIGHCRWATHGGTSDRNAHPHTDISGRFAIVHNGTINNYIELKTRLESYGFVMVSDTDTEVIVTLIAYYYDKLSAEAELNLDIATLVQKAIYLTINDLNGIWACALITSYLPNIITVFCRTCPIVLGWSEQFETVTLASEISAFSDPIQSYGRLKNDYVLQIKQGCTIDLEKAFKYVKKYQNQHEKLTPEPYEYWMLKEINEQETSTQTLISQYLNDEGLIRISPLESCLEDLLGSEHIVFIGCGTSYYAGKYARHFFIDLKRFKTVLSIDASEFELSYLPNDPKTICFLLSQSGETMDLIKVQEQLKKASIRTIAVVNVENSTVSTEADACLLIRAEREIAVASTKSYTNQVLALQLVALWLKQKLYPLIDKSQFMSVKLLPSQITRVIEENTNIIKEWAKELVHCERVFILGKKICYNVAKEAALKLKEVGYIHSEAYPASALKHGPYSLIEPGRPIIFLVSQGDENDGIMNTIAEVKSRGAFVYLITDCQTEFGKLLSSPKDSCIRLPYTNETETGNQMLSGLLQIIPFQLLAYYLALNKGHNPDYPRNLAKSVTVD